MKKLKDEKTHLIVDENIPNRKSKIKLKIKVKKNKITETQKINTLTKYLFISIIVLKIFLIISFVSFSHIYISNSNNFLTKNKINQKENLNLNQTNIGNNTKKSEIIKDEEESDPKKEKEEYKGEELQKNSDPRCSQYDPINLLSKRLETDPIILGQNSASKHICYQEQDFIYVMKNGLLCKMENIILDPSKWKDNGITYKGPLDPNNRGCPLLSKGFFNIKAETKNNITKKIGSYHYYLDGWNYDYDEKDENLEELAPGKTIFFISRNQDSPNLFHGGSEYINTLSVMYLLKINPEDIQVIFLESIEIKTDPFYDLYKNLISRGGVPYHIRTLKKKYKISKAIHVPINWDSPCFISSTVPTCQYPTTTYKYFKDLIIKYADIKPYKDSFITDNNIYYYPKNIIEKKNKNEPFKKIITFQWRRVWPVGRSHQFRILGNGPELTEKLSKVLPKYFLIRLINTAELPIFEQISIMKNTDYFIGVHGAGLFLGIFAPKNCPFHEILHAPNMNGLLLMGSLSGHRTFSDIIPSISRQVDGNENIFFNEDDFSNKILQGMKSSGLI